MFRIALGSNQGSLSSLSSDSYRGEGPDGQVVSIKRAVDERRQRRKKITQEKRKKHGQKLNLARRFGGLVKLIVDLVSGAIELSLVMSIFVVVLNKNWC